MWRRDVCARYNPGLTENRCEVGASVCFVLSVMRRKCCVLKIQLMQPAATKQLQLGVVGLYTGCLLDATNAESRNELAMNKISGIFWKK